MTVPLPKDDELPISLWLDQVKGGDRDAFEKLWGRYFVQLIRLARSTMSHSPVRSSDEDDVVQSAMASFYFRASSGKYPDLNDRDGLWKLLISITLTKARALARKEGRRRQILEREIAGENFLQGEPTPEFAAEMVDQMRHLDDRLENDLLRRIAWAKLEGYTNQEIATQIGKSLPTVERKLRLIREIWGAELERSSGTP